jgi:hypothetical protein
LRHRLDCRRRAVGFAREISLAQFQCFSFGQSSSNVVFNPRQTKSV